jgi:D-alanyl-D-alanine carboxypeptidase/D-alanyl-D-alanine-endopeptidase (penicillin-binding protein 4)
MLLVLALLLCGPLAAAPASAQLAQMDDASFVLRDATGQVRQAHHGDQPMIPASTLKILTAWLALDYWGEDYQFPTEFYVDKDHWLWIKGFGDPMLVSEELAQIAAELARLSLPVIRGIGIDTSFYDEHILIDGQANSDNPYDAPVAALVANFNTVYLRREHGRLQSAEPQTPLTGVAKKLGERIRQGKQRINIRHAQDSGRYFAELLRSKLAMQGIATGQQIREGAVPEQARRVYRHKNSRPLSEVVRAMLKYSTNLIANQLFLNLGAARFGAPATMEKAVAHAQEQVARQFDWAGFVIHEGAGLSRRNRMTALQMTELLQVFYPYRDLLKSAQPHVQAKTGTLRGIRTYAGYLNLETAVGSRKSTQALGASGESEKPLITNKVTTSFSDSPCTAIAYASFSCPTAVSRLKTSREIWPFAVFINQAAPHDLRKRLVREWQQGMR